MSMPGFTAEAVLTRSKTSYGMMAARIGSADLVLPQDCSSSSLSGLAKGLACAIYPIAWCGSTASWGGTDAFCECVDDLSRGSCLECTACSGSGRGLDPRAKQGLQGPDSQSQALSASQLDDISSQIATLSNDLKRQLNRIERCTCGIPPWRYNPLVNTVAPWIGRSRS
jgi:hypothetical protein